MTHIVLLLFFFFVIIFGVVTNSVRSVGIDDALMNRSQESLPDEIDWLVTIELFHAFQDQKLTFRSLCVPPSVCILKMH